MLALRAVRDEPLRWSNVSVSLQHARPEIKKTINSKLKSQKFKPKKLKIRKFKKHTKKNVNLKLKNV